MKRQKRAYLFDIFDSAEGAFDLFQNSIRSGMDYDSNINDQFLATVLTRPVKVTGERTPKTFVRNSDGKTENFAFMVRLEGKNSPHRFLPDPCDIEYTDDANTRRLVFNLIQQHTKVIMSVNSSDRFPEPGDKIVVTLDRNQFGSFKTDVAKNYVKFVEEASTNTNPNTDCQKLSETFKFGELISPSSAVFPTLTEKYSINDFTFKSIPMPGAADTAISLHEQIGAKGITGNTEAGAKEIYKLIHFKNYELFQGTPVPEEEIMNFYGKTIGGKGSAWSSWFLNRVYADQVSRNQIIAWHKKQVYKYYGCCYPSPLASLNRNEMLNSSSPSSFVGRKMLMVFSREEIASKRSELGLVYGDASVVGVYSTKQWEETRNETTNVGSASRGNTHLNVFVGDKTRDSANRQFIGGNVINGTIKKGSSTDYKDNSNNPGGYMKYVEIVAFNGSVSK